MHIRVLIMANYRINNHAQTVMLAINFEEQLQEGTFEYTLHHLIDKYIDLSSFDADYQNDKTGRRAYHPATLLKIILFAYSKGITSSREIAWCCQTNIIFIALSCDEQPHWTTIASFVSSHFDAIKSVFERVLLVCDQQGLLGHELIAIDGCKMPSDASKQWSGTFDELRAKRDKIRTRLDFALKEQMRLDAAGENDRAARQEKTAQSLARASDKIDAFLKAEEPRMGQGKKPSEVKSNITDNDSAKMKTSKGVIQGFNGIASVDKKNQIIVDAQVFGAGPEQHALQPVLSAIESRYEKLSINSNGDHKDITITADTGFGGEDNMKFLYEQEIDAVIPDNAFRSRDPRHQHRLHKPERKRKTKHALIIPASEFTFDPVGLTCRCPADKEMRLLGLRDDQHGNSKAFFEGYLTDCRSCPKRENCMRHPDSADDPKGHGRQVSFIKAKAKSYTEWMRHRVDSAEGREIYAHRMHVVEPVFGNIESNKGLNRFSLRGKKKVEGQWLLFSLVHNIGKLQRVAQIAA